MMTHAATRRGHGSEHQFVLTAYLLQVNISKSSRDVSTVGCAMPCRHVAGPWLTGRRDSSDGGAQEKARRARGGSLLSHLLRRVECGFQHRVHRRVSLRVAAPQTRRVSNAGGGRVARGERARVGATARAGLLHVGDEGLLPIIELHAQHLRRGGAGSAVWARESLRRESIGPGQTSLRALCGGGRLRGAPRLAVLRPDQTMHLRSPAGGRRGGRGGVAQLKSCRADQGASEGGRSHPGAWAGRGGGDHP